MESGVANTQIIPEHNAGQVSVEFRGPEGKSTTSSVFWKTSGLGALVLGYQDVHYVGFTWKSLA